MKTTKEDTILPVRYYVLSAFSLNLYSNTIERLVPLILPLLKEYIRLGHAGIVDHSV